VQRQLEGMRDGLLRLQEALRDTGSVEAQKAELAKVQVQLEQEVSLMVSVQQEQAHTVAECSRMQTVRHNVLRSEQKKAQMRANEAKELCDPVRGQLVALQQLLGECRLESSRSRSPSLRPAARPSWPS